MYRIGNLQIETLSGGRIRLDGGTMFGPVPKALWERSAPADDRNRIEMDTNLVSITTGDKRILVDTGLGVDLSEKERGLFSYQGPDAASALRERGVDPESIDLVIFTHLHWDHAAGATTRVAGTDEYRATYPNATHVVQRQEYEDALVDFGTTHGGYQKPHFVPLMEQGKLELLDGDSELLPGVRTHVTGGHTRGHQLLLFESEGERGIYFADIMPTTAHLKPAWNMSFDLFPLDTTREKLYFAEQAARGNWLCFWDHDVNVKAGRIREDGGKLSVVAEGTSNA